VIDDEDPDLIALRELHRRQSRVTNVVGVVCVLVGLAVTATIFLSLVSLQFKHLGEAELGWTMAVSSVVGIGGSVGAGFQLRRVILRRLSRGWISELAANHHDRREQLEQVASLW
jgi:hypothetical protein